MTFAVGLAADGMKPFATIYSTFLQRAYDQVVHDVAIQRLPVRFAMDRAGLGGLTATHAGSFDIGFMGALPGMVLMAAGDEADLGADGRHRRGHRRPPQRLRAIRTRGGNPAMWPCPTWPSRWRSARAASCARGTAVAIRLLRRAPGRSAWRAADLLAARGLSATVADARFAKPLDVDLILRRWRASMGR